MKKFIYATFMAEWQRVWFIVCDETGKPITNILEAKKYMQKNYCSSYWGIAEHDQMLLGNAQIDNF
jgi:hypothetical protein